MKNVVTAFVAMLICAAVLTNPAQARDQWEMWIAQVRIAIEKNKNGTKLTMAARDARCPQQPDTLREACVAAFNVIIARMEAGRQEMELMVLSTSLPAPQRDRILKIVGDYNKLNAENVSMTDQVDAIFVAHPFHEAPVQK